VLQMNETIKKAQQTIAEERKTKNREHGNLKRYLSQISGLKMSAERVRGNIMKANMRIKECEVIVKEERKKVRDEKMLLKKVQTEAKKKVRAAKEALRKVEKDKIAAIKSIKEEAAKTAKTLTETLEQTQKALDTVRIGSSGEEVVVPILSRSERDGPIRTYPQMSNRLERRTAQERGFPKGYKGSTCSKTRKSTGCQKVRIPGNPPKLVFKTLDTTEDGKYQCPHCDYSAEKKNTLREHFQEHFRPSFSCGDCGGEWAKRGPYSAHFLSMCPDGCGVIRKIKYNWENHVQRCPLVMGDLVERV